MGNICSLEFYRLRSQQRRRRQFEEYVLSCDNSGFLEDFIYTFGKPRRLSYITELTPEKGWESRLLENRPKLEHCYRKIWYRDYIVYTIMIQEIEIHRGKEIVWRIHHPIRNF